MLYRNEKFEGVVVFEPSLSLMVSNIQLADDPLRLLPSYLHEGLPPIPIPHVGVRTSMVLKMGNSVGLTQISLRGVGG